MYKKSETANNGIQFTFEELHGDYQDGLLRVTHNGAYITTIDEVDYFEFLRDPDNFI